jgi:hypothetical protein
MMQLAEIAERITAVKKILAGAFANGRVDLDHAISELESISAALADVGGEEAGKAISPDDYM